MFCPKCGVEYISSATECNDCRVPLVEHPVEKVDNDNDEYIELKTVFSTGNPAIIAIVKSLLESEGIPFITTGESIQDMFGWGRFPGKMNIISGPVKFKVSIDNADKAIEVL